MSPQTAQKETTYRIFWKLERPALQDWGKAAMTYTKAEVYIRKEDVSQIVWGPTHDHKYLVRVQQGHNYFACFVPMRDVSEWLYGEPSVCGNCAGRSWNWAADADEEVWKEPCGVCHGG